MGLCTGADFTDRELTYLKDKGFVWKPSIHMPRELARIFLRVTDIRAERVQDITWEEALLEGVAVNPELKAEAREGYYRALFAALWDSTRSEKDRKLYGWDGNPWVWRIRYERIERPKGV